MTEFSGMGEGLAWLPSSVRRAQGAESAREAAESKRQAAERDLRREAFHQRALMQYRAEAEARGDDVPSMIALASGSAGGRTIGEVLGYVRALSEAQDQASAWRQQLRGEAAPPHVFVDEPAIHGSARSDQPVSALRRAMLNRSRRFRASVEADKIADAARDAAGRGHMSYRSAQPVPAQRDEGYQGTRIRGGGYVIEAS